MNEIVENETNETKVQPVGDQELILLRFVTDRAPVTVREVAEEWGEPRGLARTTILTMMERLRKKNFLQRSKTEADSNFQYTPSVEKSVLMRGLVANFVEKTLGGSLSPFVAYLADTRGITDEEMVALRRLVEGMEPQAPDSTLAMLDNTPPSLPREPHQ